MIFKAYAVLLFLRLLLLLLPAAVQIATYLRSHIFTFWIKVCPEQLSARATTNSLSNSSYQLEITPVRRTIAHVFFGQFRPLMWRDISMSLRFSYAAS